MHKSWMDFLSKQKSPSILIAQPELDSPALYMNDAVDLTADDDHPQEHAKEIRSKELSNAAPVLRLINPNVLMEPRPPNSLFLSQNSHPPSPHRHPPYEIPPAPLAPLAPMSPLRRGMHSRVWRGCTPRPRPPGFLHPFDGSQCDQSVRPSPNLARCVVWPWRAHIAADTLRTSLSLPSPLPLACYSSLSPSSSRAVLPCRDAESKQSVLRRVAPAAPCRARP
jgi:hypothetical protein